MDGFDHATDRLTLTEVRRRILEQTTIFRPEDIIPVPCHPDALAMAYAFKHEGRAIPLRVDHGRITPAVKLTPGEQVSVEVVVRRPGWIGWLIGKTRRETLSVEAPVANVTDRWLTGGGGLPLELHFDHPVASVAVRHRSAA